MNPSASPKCVLFVDDEPHLLNGLRRGLRKWRGRWDMHFLDNAADALAMVTRRQVDVLVSDMRMPGMDGTELLRRVGKVSPGTVRIVLSGQAGGQPVLDVVHHAHQFLAKPCDADSLAGVVERACTLHDLLAQPELQRLVAQLDGLPSMPHAYREIRRELASEDASLERVGDIIGQDPAMSGKILQMVNSAFFALPRKVSRPLDAVTLLGLETIGNLVLTAGIFHQIDPALYREFALERLWLHAVRSSAICRRIAALEALPAGRREDAAAAGLLHDVGKLVLAGERPELYREVLARARRDGLTMDQAEADMLGTTHAEIGAYLLGLWGLPNGVIRAIARHHGCGETASESGPALACILHVADVLEQQMSGGMPSIPGLDHAALAARGLAARLDDWRACAAAVMQP